jgi:hypothetical protein
LIFRFSDLLGIGDRHIPALGLVDLAIRERVFGEAMDAFSAACPLLAAVDKTEEVDLKNSANLREGVLVWLQDSLLDGSVEEFLGQYFLDLARRLPDIASFPEPWFWDEVVRLIEYSLEIERLQVPRKTPFTPPDHYRLLLRHHLWTLHSAAALLSPIIYWLHHPFLPVERGEDLHRLVGAITDGGCGPMQETSVLTRLMADGIVLRPQFLRVILANDTKAAIGKMSGVSVVWKMKELLPDFDLAAYHLNERKFLDIDQRYQLPIDEEKGHLEIRCIQARHEIVKNFFVKRGFVEYRGDVDWCDVAYKLACVHSESYEPTIQGIGLALHKAIVAQLAATRRAMRLDELQNEIGLDFELSPEIIGPAIGCGRVMAYARHQRFLEKHEAYYVLSDLVETDTEKKGRIPRDRVITPTVEKHWAFSTPQFFVSAKEDSVYRLVKLITLHRVVASLSRSLPDRPTEPFFLKKMSERAKTILNERAIALGKGAYVLREDLQVFTGASEMAIEEDALRMRLISKALGAPPDLRAAVFLIADSNVREDLLTLI